MQILRANFVVHFAKELSLQLLQEMDQVPQLCVKFSGGLEAKFEPDVVAFSSVVGSAHGRFDIVLLSDRRLRCGSAVAKGVGSGRVRTHTRASSAGSCPGRLRGRKRLGSSDNAAEEPSRRSCRQDLLPIGDVSVSQHAKFAMGAVPVDLSRCRGARRASSDINVQPGDHRLRSRAEMGSGAGGLALVESAKSDSWRENLRGYGQCGRSRFAVGANSGAPVHLPMGVRPSAMIFGATISAMEKQSRWRSGIELLLRGLSVQGVEANLVTCNSAMSACEKANAWPWATELLGEEMLRKRMACDEISFNAALGACRPEWRAAGLCLQAMQEQRLGGDAVTAAALWPMVELSGQFAPLPPLLRGLLSESSERRQVEALELLEASGMLSEDALANFAGAYAGRLLPALQQLSSSSWSGPAVGDTRLHLPALERSFSLGRHFTEEALEALCLASSPCWLPTARCRSREALLASESLAASATEPVAAAIAAWASQTLSRHGLPPRYTAGFGTAEVGAPLPVFVEHDRSQHAERGVFQRLLSGVAVT
ncbi:MRL1, partial [Symbiodinium sp. CCMP2592]